MSTIRTFTAVELDEAVRQRSVGLIEQLSRVPAKIKWVEPENLHLTLVFLGDVEDHRVPAVCQSVETAVAGYEPFTIELCGVGAFPNSGRPRNLWLGVGQGGAEVSALHSSVEAAVAKLGFRPEHRRFTPHLTLGRVREAHREPSLTEAIHRLADYSAGTQIVSGVVVFSSRLNTDGPTYEVLSRATFGNEPTRKAEETGS
jgi:2'-5' RNA ligase